MKENGQLLAKTKRLCAQWGITPDTNNKGQHFLVSTKIRNLFLRYVPNRPIIEIGPGCGVFTEPLAKRNKGLATIEIDPRFAPLLTPLAKKYRFQLFFTNTLKVNFGQIIRQISFAPLSVWLVGSPPYQLMEPLLLKLSRQPREYQFLAGATFLLSQRTAQAMSRSQPPRTKLSILAISLLTSRIIKQEIGPENFWPAPRTKSAIIQLKRRQRLASFHFLWLYLLQHPRAKTENALREALIALASQKKQTLTKNQARQIIQKLALPENIGKTTVGLLDNAQLSQLDEILFLF